MELSTSFASSTGYDILSYRLSLVDVEVTRLQPSLRQHREPDASQTYEANGCFAYSFVTFVYVVLLYRQ